MNEDTPKPGIHLGPTPGKLEGAGEIRRKGVLVEDETVVGGTDAATGETVIKPKTTDGSADESVNPTDSREAPASSDE
jgi:hypothetical protein